MKLLKENEFSDLLDLDYLDKPTFQKLLSSQDDFSGIIKIKIVNKSQFRFKVSNHCGYLNLGDALYFIVPKIGIEFLDTMLQVFDKSFYRSYAGSVDLCKSEYVFDQLIAHIFISCYEQSIRPNLRKDYISSNFSSLMGAGRLDLNASKEFLCHGIKSLIWNQQHLSKDTIPNRALGSLFRMLAQRLNVPFKMRQKLSEIGAEFSDFDPKEYFSWEALLHETDRRYEHYRHLFFLASKIPDFSGLKAGSARCYTLLFPSWLLFEQACKSESSQYLEGYTLGAKDSFSVKISSEAQNSLNPDIVIKDKSSKIVLIGDCKYYENETCKLIREHLFQLNTYMDAYNLKRSFLLYPSKEYKKQSYQLHWGSKIEVIKIPTFNFRDFTNALKLTVSNLLDIER